MAISALPATMVLTGKLPNTSRIVIIGRRDYDSGYRRAAARDWVEKFTRLPFKEDSFCSLQKTVLLSNEFF